MLLSDNLALRAVNAYEAFRLDKGHNVDALDDLKTRILEILASAMVMEECAASVPHRPLNLEELRLLEQAMTWYGLSYLFKGQLSRAVFDTCDLLDQEIAAMGEPAHATE